MAALLVVLVLAILLFGVGFSVHLLWVVAAIVLVLWLAGSLFAGVGGGTGGRGIVVARTDQDGLVATTWRCTTAKAALHVVESVCRRVSSSCRRTLVVRASVGEGNTAGTQSNYRSAS